MVVSHVTKPSSYGLNGVVSIGRIWAPEITKKMYMEELLLVLFNNIYLSYFSLYHHSLVASLYMFLCIDEIGDCAVVRHMILPVNDAVEMLLFSSDDSFWSTC